MPVTNKSNQIGCLITGTIFNGLIPFSGRLDIQSERSGFYHGRFYPGTKYSIRIRNGTFSMRMVPSSILGDYLISSSPPGINMIIAVPDNSQANIEDIIK